MRLRSIRIFHYDKDSGEYIYNDYRGTAELQDGIRSEDGGAKRRCEGSIRLMTSGDITVRPGDYASLKNEEKPDKERDFPISAVKDNRRGGLPHWRLLVGRGQNY